MRPSLSGRSLLFLFLSLISGPIVAPLHRRSRVRIWLFCPRRSLLMLLAELRQEPALLRVLRKRNSSGKASSDAGPELAGRESCVAMESPQALMCPLEKGINKSSSDDRPGPGICDSKYVEDAKAARSVRVWDRVPMKT